MADKGTGTTEETTETANIPVQRFHHIIDENIVSFSVRGEQITLVVGTREANGEGEIVTKINAFVEIRLSQLEEVVAAARDQLTRYAPYSEETVQKIAIELRRHHRDVLEVLDYTVSKNLANDSTRGVIRLRYRTRKLNPFADESENDRELEEEVVEIANADDLSRVVRAANERRIRWNTAVPTTPSTRTNATYSSSKSADAEGQLIEDPVNHRWLAWCAVETCYTTIELTGVTGDLTRDEAEIELRGRGWLRGERRGWYCPDHGH